MTTALKIAAKPPPSTQPLSPQLALAMGRALSEQWRLMLLLPVTEDGLDALAPQLEQLSGSRAFEGLQIVDARGLSPESRSDLLARLSAADRAVVLVDPPQTSLLATLLCTDADALLLLAHANEARVEDARTVVELCGREKFLGSLMLEGGTI